MPVCAQCQSRQNNWWDLVQHIQTAHNTILYIKDEDLESHHGKGEEEDSTCSNCSTADSRNGTSLTQDCCWEEQRDAATEADIRDEEEEMRQQPPAEDKSVDTTDLKTSLG
ncbi:uncharacterized protein LOC118180950 [Stegodyphus dumicola]|uniref:uncharacterized protein LOC118180950 n=1 Tax=Stegodyphus dumicola TaxID=202533 RepID=UPI0015A8EDDF|nr:uncharacterized protein LOC118180950 [Stegodyphus dumicola]